MDETGVVEDLRVELTTTEELLDEEADEVILDEDADEVILVEEMELVLVDETRVEEDLVDETEHAEDINLELKVPSRLDLIQ